MSFVVAVTLVLLSAGSAAVEFHVSPGGDDENAGSAEAPFATLEKARDAVRGQEDGATVWIHDGVYRLEQPVSFTAEDSGLEGGLIQFRAVNPGAARLSGGRDLPADSFSPITDEATLVRLPEGAHAAVRRADLGALGINDLGVYPDQFRTAQAIPELFFNGARMTLAQWPNEGWAEIDTVVESGAAPWRNHESDALAVFTYAGDGPERWVNEDAVWLEGYWCFDWASETIRIQSVDPATRQIGLAKTHVYGVGSGNSAPRRFRAVNLLAELDQAGEYYIDRDEGTLYFWPPAPLDGARIALSITAKPLIELKDVSHVQFTGLVLEDCAGTAMTVSGGEQVTVAGCTIRNAGLQALEVIGGWKHTIQSCDIYDNGTGGVVIEGGDRKTLTPSGHRVVNNHIYRVSERMRTSAYNLLVRGVGVYVAHNEFNDAPHQAIGWAGNDHIFELNNVHHASMNSDDCGAFYMGRNPSDRGSIIRYNYWHEIGSEMAHGSCAIYFDDGDGGQTVHGNVFYKASGGNFGAVFNHGGHDNVVTNNIFIECDLALGTAPWGDGHWKEWVEGDLWQKNLLEEVDITKPPYSERYPELAGFFKFEGLRQNHATNNVAVRCKYFAEGNWDIGASVITMEDPGFSDMAAKDFSLREDSAVYSRLPDFEAIPFAEIGLQTDAYRTISPKE